MCLLLDFVSESLFLIEPDVIFQAITVYLIYVRKFRSYFLLIVSLNLSMGLFELISHIIFPNEYIFDGDYFRGQPIFNQPQLLGGFSLSF